MNNNIHPCIWYNGNAKAAAEFYCTLFPNSKITTDSPMVIKWQLADQTFMGLNAGPMFTPNASVSFMVTCEEDAEINNLWAKLSDGGKVMMPLDKYDWSERYGFVEDKFGLAWQIFKGKYSDVNQKITPTLLFVGKNFGKAAAAVKYYTDVIKPAAVEGIFLYAENEGPAAGSVKHSQFILDGKVFMAMDGYGEHAFAFNEGISFVAECDGQEEIDYFWNELTSNGGAESMCGWLKDKFGLSWQIIPKNIGAIMINPVNGQKAMQALMQMKKIEVDKLLNA
jgi:predicted 3-demethylubiquinone-9 3-methyltransferase (glyoxalase superfamily)